VDLEAVSALFAADGIAPLQFVRLRSVPITSGMMRSAQQWQDGCGRGRRVLILQQCRVERESCHRR